MKLNILSKRCISRTTHLGISCLLLTMPLAAGSTRIYVANTAGTTVSVIDTGKNKVVQEIKDIQVPESVAISPDGKRVYITQFTEKILTVVDRKSGKKIKEVPVSGHAADVAVTRDGKWILVCNTETPGALDIIDAATLQLVKSIPSKVKLHDVVVTPDSKFAIATTEGAGFIEVFDLQSQTIAWDHKFEAGTQVVQLDSNPDGSARRVYVQVARLRGFAVLDFATHQEVARVTLPDDEPIVGTSQSGHGLTISPDGKSIWVNCKAYNAAFIYSLPDLKYVGRVHTPALMPPGHDPISGSPNWITFTPDGKMAYISNAADRSVSVVDTTTLKITTRIPVGEEAGRMAAVAVH